jgi:hypothetical protein
MLPTKIEHKSFWVQQYSEEQLDDFRVDDLTKLEEFVKLWLFNRQNTNRQWDDTMH